MQKVLVKKNRGKSSWASYEIAEGGSFSLPVFSLFVWPRFTALFILKVSQIQSDKISEIYFYS